MLGQYVKQKNDNRKIIYQVVDRKDDVVIIKGVNYRIVKSVNVDNIEEASKNDIQKENENTEKYYYKLINSKSRIEKKFILGTILHVDGDQTYLAKCLELYDALGIFAYGVKIEEKNMKEEIEKILTQISPDIIVITGHDSYNSKGLSDLENYKNTIHFMEAVKAIRKHNSNCCIIAGACQSNFEALMACGASFASSPKRVNIHTFDPAVIAIKVSTTSFVKIVDFEGIVKFIEEGRKAYGGVETFGKMKMLL
jgi:spore coat assembly protein